MRKLLAGLIIFLVTLSAAFVLSKRGVAGADGFEKLSFTLASDSESYTPGRLVTVKMKIVNASADPVVVWGKASVEKGSIQIFISRDGTNFKEYTGPGWGLNDAISVRGTRLEPAQGYETEATILYQLVENTSHLNPEYAKQVSEQSFGSGYVLGRPGVYWIKALLYDSDYKKSKESNTIQVAVYEPRGEDLEIWNAIKDKPQYGYFIQTGEPPYPLADRRTDELVAALKGLAAAHPGNGHAQSINQSLSKFESTKEKIERQKRKN